MLPPSPIIDRCKTGVLAPLAFLAGAKLDVFTELASGEMTVEELSAAMDVDPVWIQPMLFALAATGLLIHEKGRFSNSDEADYYLVRGRPHFIGDIGSLFEDLWRGALLAADSVKLGKPLAAHDYGNLSETGLKEFFRGQHPDALLAGWKLADAIDFSNKHNLADVGGGSGGIAIALCERHPKLQGTVLELPAVAKVATDYMAASEARDRLSAIAVDLLAPHMSGNYDLAVMRSLLQVLGPSDCQTVLENVRSILAPGATLYIIGQIVDDDRINPETVALFNLVFLSFYEQGRVYTETEHRDWLESAGYVDIERRITANGLNMIVACNPQ